MAEVWINPDDYDQTPRPVVGIGNRYPPSFELAPHSHGRGQLLYAASGVIVVSTAHGAWVAPPIAYAASGEHQHFAGTASIGVLLIVIAIVLALEIKSLLLGEAASPENVAAVRASLVGEGVVSVIHLRTMHLGPEEILVAAKIEVDAAETAAEVAHAIDAAENRVRAALPGIEATVFLEPDLRRALAS